MPAASSIPAEPARPARWQHVAASRDACCQLTLGIVHEMNNLTGGISVLSEIYMEGADSGLPLTEGLTLIHKSTDRLQTLVRHLKVINGPISEEPTYFNVAEFVRSLFELFAPLLPKDMVVHPSFPPEELAACLDEALFRQVLLNLTLNLREALDTEPAAEHRLHLGLRRLSDTRAELVLALAGDFGDDFHGTVPESDLRWAGAHARLLDADDILKELGGRLTCRPGGEYVFELPLIS